MENKLRRNDPSVGEGVWAVESLVRTPIELSSWDDKKIAKFYKRLLELPDHDAKTRAIEDYHLYMARRQKMLDRNGGKLPFSDTDD